MSNAVPVVSFLVQVGPREAPLAASWVASLEQQTDDGWELWLCGPDLDAAELAAASPSIHVVAGDVSQSERVGSAIAGAQGELVCLVEAGSRLSAGAVQLIRETLLEQPRADVIYADEALVDPSGLVQTVVCPPEWSPARLRGHDYLRHFVLIRTELLRSITGSAGDPRVVTPSHDLVLRATEAARGIVRIPEVLIARTAADVPVPDALWDASVGAVQGQLDRLGRSGRAERGVAPGTVRVVHEGDRSHGVTAVIATDGRSGLVRGERRCYVVEAVRSLMAAPPAGRLQVVVVHTPSCPPRVLEEFRAVAGDALTVSAFGKPFDVPAMVNRGVAATIGEILVLLDQRTEVSAPDCLDQLVAPLADPEIGITGPLVSASNQAPVGTGLAIFANRVSPMYASILDDGPAEELFVSREVSALDGTCLAITRESFEAVGGLTESLPDRWDVDLSLKVARLGLGCLWVASAQVTSFGDPRVQPWPDPEERQRLFTRWLAPDVDRFAPVYGRRLQRRRRDDQGRFR